MICQATYASQEEIPEAFRDEFENVNGKWQLKESAVPGAGPLFNAALAKNEQKAVNQVKTRNTRIEALEKQVSDLESERDDLKDELTKVKTDDARVLSKEDGEAFDQYVKLGTPTDVAAKLDEFEAVSADLNNIRRQTVNQEIASAGNLNTDVLNEWTGSVDMENVEVFVKEVSDKSTGKEVTNKVPYVRYEVEEAGKKITKERELVEYAKEKMPEWKFSALTSVQKESSSGNGNGKVRLPNLGKASGSDSAPAKSDERPVDKFNKQRDSRPAPWAAAIGLVPKTDK